MTLIDRMAVLRDASLDLRSIEPPKCCATYETTLIDLLNL